MPSVISEIWNCYLDRTIDRIIIKGKYEKEKAVNELSLLKERTQGNPFPKGEETDFEYIFNSLNYFVKFDVHHYDNKSTNLINIPITEFSIEIPFLTLLMDWLGDGHSNYSSLYIMEFLQDAYNKFFHQELVDSHAKIIADYYFDTNVRVEMQSFGLIKGNSISREVTSKIFRFRYWLGYYKIIELVLTKELFNRESKKPS